MDSVTLRRHRAACAMLVCVPVKVVEACTGVLAAHGYRVVNVNHVPAACERMAVLMPRVVVGDADATNAEREELRERAVAVGAQILWFPREADAAFVASATKLAAITALEAS